MPILKFNGTTEEKVKEYSKKINEIADLIVSKPEAILMMVNNNNIFVAKNTNKRIYVEVDWLKRSEESRVLLVQHLTNFFGNQGVNVSVKFTEINNDLYVNNEKRG
ncbi:unknown protein [Mesoplasma florum L1]|uniref:DUF1904 domain-containing protein n=1 Tax=Mesoplasma florum (strain ATCC 33453 / NBRC 100688 / NCTC 11704 / L1) TaxID=265311 RepID=Q6F289_MESFL|nr:DUF1904 family protein [Mesoplasma florum]AAT75384.1 unknown protein [Mesoplasma florum L1]ATI72985.1 DUF1904 domain-containing protein [Mesoplasma florum]ATI73675.1 DUF1904 domain-containing protein [Mesoplasma florum]AVN61388.1 DUF1904 domain-containing protein [Mesoplasma florum]